MHISYSFTYAPDVINSQGETKKIGRVHSFRDIGDYYVPNWTKARRFFWR